VRPVRSDRWFGIGQSVSTASKEGNPLAWNIAHFAGQVGRAKTINGSYGGKRRGPGIRFETQNGDLIFIFVNC
jgi:hypothetical protein